MSAIDADAMAVATDSDETDSVNQAMQFVTFSVADELFAVPMGPVQEIIRVPDVARLPLAPNVLDGLANLRGRVLPIISLRRMFGCQEKATDDSSRAVVINLSQPLGFIVDKVTSVVSIEPNEIQSAHSIQSMVDANYLTGIIHRQLPGGNKELLLTLDFAALVDKHFTVLSQQQNTSSNASHVAEIATEDEDTQNGTRHSELRLVSFSVDGQEYAIDIEAVMEIVQMPSSLTGLPNSPPHVMGIISLRQRLLPLVCLRRLFNLTPTDISDHQRIVVVAMPNGQQVGLITDSVKEVMSISKDLADDMPSMLADKPEMQEFSRICRLDNGKRLVSIIDTDRLLGMAAFTDAVNLTPDHSERTEETILMQEESEDQLAGDEDIQVVIFKLGAEEFGVPIMTVQEIVRVPDNLTRIPKTPEFVEGVINLRGTVLPVIDQRLRLGMDAIERNEGQRIMVYLLDGVRTGFIVDAVAEVLRIPKAQITRSPTLSDEQSKLISQIAKLNGDKRLVMLLDPRQLLGQLELTQVQALLSKHI